MLTYRYILLALGCALLVAAGVLWQPDDAAGQGDPVSGEWRGTVEFEADSGVGTAEMSFQIDDAGQVNAGVVILKFSYPTMPEDMLNLMLQHGCQVSFEAMTPDSIPVAGTFVSSAEASGSLTASHCLLQDYGNLEFMSPLMGTWSAAPVNPPSAAAPADDSSKPTRIHTLDPNQPTARPTRMPTLNPNQPTTEPSRPTRVPTLDPNQPTARPTRVPTLDPNQPTTAPDSASQNSDATTDAPSNAAAPAEDTASASTTDSGAVAIAAGDEFPNDPPGAHPTDNMSARQMYKEFCEECHGQRGLGTEDAPELEALNATTIADTVRDGPEDMDVFTHEDIPDRTLNTLIDYVLLFHPDSEPRTTTIITPPTTE